MAKKTLARAKVNKRNEFYTQYSDIEREMNAFIEYDKNVFKNKVILCPCDDPEISNFTKYFAQNFERLGLKKFISTSYAKSYASDRITQFEKESEKYNEQKHRENGKIFILEKDKDNSGHIDIDDLEFEYLNGDGDFNSVEVKSLRDEADIIITNPPFALFISFFKWIMEANKNFIIIGEQTVIGNKEIFPFVKENKIWLGLPFPSNVGYFVSPYEDTAVASSHKEGYIRVPGVAWLTNIDYGNRHETHTFSTKKDNLKYNKKLIKMLNENGLKDYPYYDNYDNILEIPVSSAVPSDYNGLMGVPITFMYKFNPEEFEIVGIAPERQKNNPILQTKFYSNAMQHNEDGTTIKGNKINDSPALLIEKKPNGKYYTCDEYKNGYLKALFLRIIIKRRKQ